MKCDPDPPADPEPDEKDDDDDTGEWIPEELGPTMYAPCQACGALTRSRIDIQDRGPDDEPRISLGFRRAVACADCLDKMDADMWVSRAHWEALNPRTPYDQLPILRGSCEIPAENIQSGYADRSSCG